MYVNWLMTGTIRHTPSPRPAGGVPHQLLFQHLHKNFITHQQTIYQQEAQT
jgi:hypothetical protein